MSKFLVKRVEGYEIEIEAFNEEAAAEEFAKRECENDGCEYEEYEHNPAKIEVKNLDGKVRIVCVSVSFDPYFNTYFDDED